MQISRRIIFFVVVVGSLVGLNTLVYKTFRNFIREKAGDKSRWNLLASIPFIVFNLPFIYIFAIGFKTVNIDPLVYKLVFYPFYIFQGAVIFIGLYLLAGKIIKAPFAIPIWLMNKFDSFKEKYDNFLRKKPVKKFDQSRRTFVRTSAALVSGYAFIGATSGVLQSDDYQLTELDIKLNNLPKNLDGTTITLLSDIHSGPYMKEGLMRRYVDSINEIGSDIVMMPGDLTNSQQSEAFTFANAFKYIKAKHGVFASLGNHDYFSDPNHVANVLTNETPVKVLRNQSELLNINGSKLLIMGSEDTRQSSSTEDPVLLGHFESTVASAKEKLGNEDLASVPKLLLFHKPYFFDEMSGENIDLMLSGHTHGGQVVFAKLGPLNMSFAGFVSKYISGLYEKNGSQMYVSRGIGNVALPIRFNCSPEITKITLRA